MTLTRIAKLFVGIISLASRIIIIDFIGIFGENTICRQFFYKFSSLLLLFRSPLNIILICVTFELVPDEHFRFSFGDSLTLIPLFILFLLVLPGINIDTPVYFIYVLHPSRADVRTQNKTTGSWILGVKRHFETSLQ